MVVAVKKQQQQRQPNKSIQGNALVLALFIVMITSAIAYALIQTSTFAVRRTTQLSDMDTCEAAVHAAELYASGLLHQPKGEGEMTTTLLQNWALPFEMQLSKELQVQGQVIDLQGQMNVNLLQQKEAAGMYTPGLIWTRLLVLLNIPDAQSLQQALALWVGNEAKPEDRIYLERTPPYQVAHASLASISELRLIQGYSAKTLSILTPYISALPEANNININTASAEVLAALLDTPLGSARSLVDDRLGLAFASGQEFIDRAKAKGIAIPDQAGLQKMISINSRYFLLKSTVQCKKTSLISYSFINRLSEGEAKVYQRTQQL